MHQGIDIELIKNSNFLITGGAGFIGSNIVHELIAIGAKKVIVLDNLSNGNLNNLNSYLQLASFEFIEGDILELETCVQACENIDFVCHQAGLGSVPRSIENPIATNAANIDGFINIMEAVRISKVKRIVYASSSSVYGDSPEIPKKENHVGNPMSPYAVSKLVNELYAFTYKKNYNIDSIGLRYFNVFGPKQNPKGEYSAVIPRFIKCIISDSQPVIHGDGLQTRDFTYVSNVVQANLLSVSTINPSAINQVYNIASAGQLSVLGLWEELTKIAQCSLIPTFKPSRKSDVKQSLASIEKAKQLLGYQPNIQVEEGIKLAFNWFKNNPTYII